VSESAVKESWFADDRVPEHLQRLIRGRPQARRVKAVGGRVRGLVRCDGRVGGRRAVVGSVADAVRAVAGELQAQVHQVIQGGGVDLAGDHRDESGVARYGAGGPAVQPRGAVAAGLRGDGAVGSPPDDHLPDPLILQDRSVVQGAQLGQGHMRPDFDRLASPLGEQTAGDQAAQ
jgi:hypothetical protein